MKEKICTQFLLWLRSFVVRACNWNLRPCMAALCFFVWSSRHSFYLCWTKMRWFELTAMSSHTITPRYPSQILCLVCVGVGKHEARIVLLAKLCKKSACLKEIPQTVLFAPKYLIMKIFKTNLLVNKSCLPNLQAQWRFVWRQNSFPSLSYELIFSRSLIYSRSLLYL